MVEYKVWFWPIIWHHVVELRKGNERIASMMYSGKKVSTIELKTDKSIEFYKKFKKVVP